MLINQSNTAIQSYFEGEASGKFDADRNIIYIRVLNSGPSTANELARFFLDKHGGSPADYKNIGARCSELKCGGSFIVSGKKIDPITNKTVNVYKATGIVPNGTVRNKKSPPKAFLALLKEAIRVSKLYNDTDLQIAIAALDDYHIDACGPASEEKP